MQLLYIHAAIDYWSFRWELHESNAVLIFPPEARHWRFHHGSTLSRIEKMLVKFARREEDLDQRLTYGSAPEVAAPIVASTGSVLRVI